MHRLLWIALKGLVLLTLVFAVFVYAKNTWDSSFARAQSPPTGPLLKVDGVDVHAHIEGEGPTLIMLHGAGGNTRDFTYSLTKKLSDRYKIVAFDRPGHGHTGRIEDREKLGETPQEQADLLSKAADQLGLKDYLILGHSFGGAVTMAWAVEHPEQVRGLIMVAGVSNPWQGDLAQWYQTTNTWFGRNILIPTLSALATPARVNDTTNGIFEPDPVPEGYLDHVGVGLSKSKRTLQATTQQVNNLKPSVIELEPSYSALKLPIEIVHGTADVTVPLDTHGRPLSQQASGAVLDILEGVGHMPHHAQEDRVIAAIDRAANRAGLR